MFDVSEQYDVCIIGSGPAGTTLAKTLVNQGVKTLMIESGTTLFQWLTEKRIKNMASFESVGNANYPVKHTRGFLLGGTSNFWTGRCERFHPSDFEQHPYTPPENPWPITYKDLDPYYDKAEKILRVRGGERSGYTPHRQGPFPLQSKLDISYLKRVFREIGVSVDDSPTATPTKTFRFFKVQKEILPSILSSPHFNLVSGATVSNSDSKGIYGNSSFFSLRGIRK